MNINFGLFPPIDGAVKGADGKRLRGPAKAQARKRALTERAKERLTAWSHGPEPVAAQMTDVALSRSAAE
jgi:methylenetetrahydrofolate--tRNA-(uracil-5-)-methyltransferase